MTPLFGLLLVLGCAVVVAVFVLIWRAIPVFQCPYCGSIETDDVDVDGVTYTLCLYCKHEWRNV